jgi:hypothetical protein
MELHIILTEHSNELVNAACKSLSRAKLKSYSSSEESENRKRFEKLMELTTECINKRKLLPIISYIEETARERYYAGFDFSEVHSAINILEEVIWNKIITSVKPEQLGESLGLVSTVLGAAKESLGITYISLSSKTKVPALDLNALFESS